MRLTDIQYRGATESDMGQISDLLASVRGDVGDLHHEQFLVACIGGVIFGCVRIKELANGEKELASLAVAPEWRNRGIGSALVSKVVSKERRSSVYLHCFQDRRAFYARHGFRVANLDELPPAVRDESLRIMTAFAGSEEKVVAMVLTGTVAEELA